MCKTTTLTLCAIATLAAQSSTTVAAQDAAAPEGAEQACTITIAASTEVSNALAQNALNFDGFAALCPALREAGLGVSVYDTHGIVADRSYGLSTLNLYDLSSDIMGWTKYTSTSMSEDVGESVGVRLVIDSLNSSLQAMSEEAAEAAASVREETERLRGIAAPTPPNPEPSSDGCKVVYSSSQDFFDLFETWTDLDVAGLPLCEGLHQTNAGVQLTEATGELTGRSYAWVTATFFDQSLLIEAPYRVTTFVMADETVPADRNQMLRQALEGAGAAMRSDQEGIFASLSEEVAGMRARLGAAAVGVSE